MAQKGVPPKTEGDMHMTRTELHAHPWLGMSLTLLAFGAASAVPQAQVRAVTLDIKAQPIGSALNEFARQSGVQVLLYSEVSAGLSVAGLVGTFAPDAALTKLLSNTGLTFEYVNSRTVAIHRVVGNVSKGAATHGEPERLFMRLANVQVAESQNEDEQIRAAANRREPDNNKRLPRSLEEVVVTAQKRAESIQDVPISIEVVGADEIDQRGLVSAADYLRGIPGVNQMDSYQGQSIVIRGMETNLALQNFWSGSTTATYFGETPTTNSMGLSGNSNVDLKLVDIERVEVLRGPQGTAFGSSSMGGAVRTIPVPPKLDRFEGKVAGGYSVTSGTGGDNHNVQAVGNVPLIKDRFGIRATAYQYQDGGFYHNVANSDAAFQAVAVTPFGAGAFATDQDEVGSNYVIGGRIAAVFQASENLQFSLSYLSQRTETDGIALATSGAYEQTLLQVAPEHVVRGQKGGVFDADIDIANATMDYSFGWANLLATYSYVQSESIVSLPYTSLMFNWPASSKSSSDHRERVGEIRLVTHLDGAWNFLAGLYAEDLKDDLVIDYLWFADPATNFLARGQRSLGVRDPDRRNLKQKAAFGEASWEIVRGLKLTGGVRAYEYDRMFQVDASGAFFGASGTHARADTKASGENFRANLSYKIDDNALLYTSWSEGFRLGQLQPGLPPGACDTDGDGIVDGTDTTIASTRRVESDNVESAEIGAKLTLLDRRLTIAADVFRMKWFGVPVNVRAGDFAGCRVFAYLANAGSVLSEGVEFQANFQATESFRVDFGGSWTHARLTEAVPALNVPEGNRLPGSPEANANLGLQYKFEIGDYAAFVRTDSIYVGSFYGDLLESAKLESGDYVKHDASARVEIGNLNIDLFVLNLTNEDAFTNRGTLTNVGQFYGYRLRPRTIGLQLGFVF